ncbi:MAG: His/Gly/Thr/Pro-type tRNA ligase C-terminal domain-containing protein [Candidatus Pacebacteria bacterium]|nr:His/Gly/Thr/Pro-type tRNA ligase C-terminal domain-containing protein [Candidatus Paceibacterota bacterium]
MLQSQLFTKTRKDAPKDEVAKNAELLIRAGFIHKEMAGVYSYLPLGLRVLNKIAEIIRREMNAIGGQEVFMTTLQSKELWEKTGRWSDEKVDNWFKTKLKNGTELGLGFTHEEMLTAIMAEEVKSYKDLPRYVYQIQTKFRNEARAKSGIMRGREFMMKDLYSFSRDEKEHEAFYKKSQGAYMKVFESVGLGEKTYLTFASGGVFSKYSHEFQTLTSAGEDLVYICDKCRIAVNKEIIEDQKNACPQCGNKKLREEKAVEVGNIFPLGTRFSDALGLKYLDEKGESKSVVMGSYGIGLGRLMGTIVEVFADDVGIVWPKEVSPFAVHLVSLAGEDAKVKKSADALYKKLTSQGIEVLYDDRDARAGEKFADSDLIGIPVRVVVSAKTLEKDSYEIKDRKTGQTEIVKEEVLLKIFR